MAKSPKVASPGSLVPVSSNAIIRSPSPSKAKPISKVPVSKTVDNDCGHSLPTPSLIFDPFGASPTVVVSEPNASNTSLANALKAPFEQSNAIRLPLNMPFGKACRTDFKYSSHFSEATSSTNGQLEASTASAAPTASSKFCSIDSEGLVPSA